MTVVQAAPARLADVLSPTWLSDVLGDLADGEAVVDVRAVGTSKTLASKVRFEAVVEGPDGRTAVRCYCVKGQFDDAGARPLDLVVEARFYRDVGPVIGVRMPRAYYTGIDEANGRSLIIMDDLTAAGGRFLDTTTRYTPEMAAEALRQLALLHARTWGEERLAELEWLAPPATSRWESMPTDFLQAHMDDGRAEGLPPTLRDAGRIKEAMVRVTAPQRICVVHGDPHSLNVYLDDQGRPGLLDWQLAHIGHWATDVAYHVASVLDVDTRRRHEAALVRGYLEELARLGPEPPPWDQAWEQYQRHLAYGYFLWCVAGITPRVDIVEHVPRLGAALVDHDTLARLGL